MNPVTRALMIGALLLIAAAWLEPYISGFIDGFVQGYREWKEARKR